MTRELKLALIVGFALVLLVTVLISDHLSKSRNTQLATEVEPAPLALPEPQLEPQGPVVRISQGAGGWMQTDPTSPVMVGPNAPRDAALVDANPSSNSSLQRILGERVGEPVPAFSELKPLVGVDRVDLANGLTPPIIPLSEQPRLNINSDSFGQSPDSASMSDRSSVTPLGIPRAAHPMDLVGGTPNIPLNSGKPEPRHVLDSTPSDTVKITPPAEEERWHTVVKGDSAFSIAKKYYGKGEAWTKLRDYNGDRIGKDGQLREGVRLKIPAPEKLGLRNDAPKSQPGKPEKTNRVGESRIAGRAESTPSKSARVYVVKKGDTLGQIAQRELGSMKRADEILRLNKDTLHNPNAVREGMKLQLPVT